MDKPKYCECCGRLLADIKKECLKHGTVTKTNCFDYNGHEYHLKHDAVYPKNHTLAYCEFCGAKLEDDDIKLSTENHEFWGAPCSETFIAGYRCKNCGADELF